MKPLAEASGATTAGPTTAGSTTASSSSRPSVADQLRDVDMSVLEQLVGISQEQARLKGYRDRADEMKNNVSQAVYRRVADDYVKRSAALERQAAPLRAKALVEYQKLRQLVQQVSRANEQAKSEKEELEFRGAVGELDEGRLADEVQAPQHVLDECGSDLASIDEHKARFIEAFGSEAALESPGPAEKGATAPLLSAAAAPAVVVPTAAASVPAAPPAVTASVPASTDVVASPPLSAPPVPSVETSVQPRPVETSVQPRPVETSAQPRPNPDATMMFTGDATQLMSPGKAPALPPPLADDFADGRTILVPLGALIAESGVLAQKVYQLGAVNYLGRGEDNQIQITSPGVSRKHAVISAVASEFQLKDLGSQNGVLVNGQRVTERKLADNDRIEIADVAMTFRSPWPVRMTSDATAAKRTAKK